ncbi:hypothetical protein AVEN_111594-1, partial [Araneus ventricosus]
LIFLEWDEDTFLPMPFSSTFFYSILDDPLYSCDSSLKSEPLSTLFDHSSTRKEFLVQITDYSRNWRSAPVKREDCHTKQLSPILVPSIFINGKWCYISDSSEKM